MMKIKHERERKAITETKKLGKYKLRVTTEGEQKALSEDSSAIWPHSPFRVHAPSGSS